jgi:hypothetical protein
MQIHVAKKKTDGILIKRGQTGSPIGHLPSFSSIFIISQIY